MGTVGFVDSLENMLFGDPVYDERGQVVKRNFGLMNAIMIVLLVVIGIGLFQGFPNMKPKSGKKKMKGGDVVSKPKEGAGAMSGTFKGPKSTALGVVIVLGLGSFIARVAPN